MMVFIAIHGKTKCVCVCVWLHMSLTFVQVQVGFGLVTEALAASVPSSTDRRASWRDVTASSGHPRRGAGKSDGERKREATKRKKGRKSMFDIKPSSHTLREHIRLLQVSSTFCWDKSSLQLLNLNRRVSLHQN